MSHESYPIHPVYTGKALNITPFVGERPSTIRGITTLQESGLFVLADDGYEKLYLYNAMQNVILASCRWSIVLGEGTQCLGLTSTPNGAMVYGLFVTQQDELYVGTFHINPLGILSCGSVFLLDQDKTPVVMNHGLDNGTPVTHATTGRYPHTIGYFHRRGDTIAGSGIVYHNGKLLVLTRREAEFHSVVHHQYDVVIEDTGPHTRIPTSQLEDSVIPTRYEYYERRSEIGEFSLATIINLSTLTVESQFRFGEGEFVAGTPTGYAEPTPFVPSFSNFNFIPHSICKVDDKVIFGRMWDRNIIPNDLLTWRVLEFQSSLPNDPADMTHGELFKEWKDTIDSRMPNITLKNWKGASELMLYPINDLFSDGSYDESKAQLIQKDFPFGLILSPDIAIDRGTRNLMMPSGDMVMLFDLHYHVLMVDHEGTYFDGDIVDLGRVGDGETKEIRVFLVNRSSAYTLKDATISLDVEYDPSIYTNVWLASSFSEDGSKEIFMGDVPPEGSRTFVVRCTNHYTSYIEAQDLNRNPLIVRYGLQS